MSFIINFIYNIIYLRVLSTFKEFLEIGTIQVERRWYGKFICDDIIVIQCILQVFVLNLVYESSSLW